MGNPEKVIRRELGIKFTRVDKPHYDILVDMVRQIRRGSLAFTGTNIFPKVEGKLCQIEHRVRRIIDIQTEIAYALHVPGQPDSTYRIFIELLDGTLAEVLSSCLDNDYPGADLSEANPQLMHDVNYAIHRGDFRQIFMD